MAQNLFEELQTRKQGLVALAEKAAEFGWIAKERKDEIIDKIRNDVLTIGVIGQMKSGKSTFLNAFVFEDDVLPLATTPMTAALSKITYGPTKKIVAEFYDRDDWAKLEMDSQCPLVDEQGNLVNKSEELKIKAAKELVESAGKLGSTIESYLGSTKEDDFSNLIEYVGANGKYVPITKSVTIYWPEEYLKGVEIVDTPGFNDPIVSREERTREFLQTADAVLMMQYVGRVFDETDRDILFKTIRQSGIGKVVIVINKYDLIYSDPNSKETEEGIMEYIKHEIKKACMTQNDDFMTEMVRQTNPVFLSAEMALLSELPMSKIMANDNYKKRYSDYLNQMLDTGSQSEMRDKSYIDSLISVVKQMIETEKDKILFAKPLNAIKAAGMEKVAEIEKTLLECRSLIKNIDCDDDELDEKIEDLERAKRRLDKKIDSFGSDLEMEYKQVLRTGKNELEDEVIGCCRRMKGLIENVGALRGFNSINDKLNDELRSLKMTLTRAVDALSEEVRNKTRDLVNDFLFDDSVNDLLIRHLPDMEREILMSRINRLVMAEMDNMDNDGLPSISNLFGQKSRIGRTIARISGAVFGVVGLGVSNTIVSLVSHNKDKREYLEEVNSFKEDFDPSSFLESIIQNKDEIIKVVRDAFITDLIEPMGEQIEMIRSGIENKERMLAEAKAKEEETLKAKAETESQLAEVDNYIKTNLRYE